ncbi:MAG TPA: adenylate/guanylate cyclase domain-containing protein, partial [Candidatus Sulfotelmatobacter sp.]|nr:adenylate/guanylate cyclase domain-containing protein [Candidatus Sulfotelmatobacter sp.]
TDIEGSTRLVERLGTAAWTDLLEAHQAIIRAALAAATGVEVKTEGDSFFAVFTSAATAVAAAAAMQRDLHAHAWPHDAPLRVRMGLHTGEGVVAPDADYVGLDVHRAARVASAAHGGEVVLSEATSTLVAGALPAGTSLRDLGEHRLKDLSRPERISQLVIEGVPDEFPSLRTLDVTPNNLPVMLTDFIGREAVLAEAHRLLEGTRLLTLTGPGGTGKTRLSLQLAADVAERFSDGIYFVALEPISDPALVPSTIAMAMGVQDVSGASIEDRLRGYLHGRTVLLVLDNMEQVTGAAPFIGDLLRTAPGLTCIVTSRAALHIYGEQEYPVPTLGIPDLAHLPPLEGLAQVDGVALFVERARTARPDFQLTEANAPAVARLVAALDGLPLALELAAARIKVLTPEGMLERLQGRLDLLGGGSRDLPARQQTLRGAIAWSYDLLDPATRRLFACIAVFVGGFELEAAEAVCGPGPAGAASLDVLDGLSSLVDQSLLRQDAQHTHPRFVMLETIRSFALERLAADGLEADMRRRHAEYFAGFAEGAMPHLTGRQRAIWLDRVQDDHDNLRAAIAYALEVRDAHLGMRLIWALWRFWQSRSHLQEGAEHCAAILALPTDEGRTELRARALEASGGIAYWRGDEDQGRSSYDAALAIAREIGRPELVANALYNASMVRGVLSPNPTNAVEEGRAMLDEAVEIYRRLGDRDGEARALWGIGTVQYFSQDSAAARETFAAAERAFAAGDDGFMQAWALHMLGSAEVRLGSLDAAEAHIREALERMREAGETTGMLMIVSDFADVAAGRGQLPRALRLLGAGRALEEASGAKLASLTDELLQRNEYGKSLSRSEAQAYEAEGRRLN